MKKFALVGMLCLMGVGQSNAEDYLTGDVNLIGNYAEETEIERQNRMRATRNRANQWMINQENLTAEQKAELEARRTAWQNMTPEERQANFTDWYNSRPEWAGDRPQNRGTRGMGLPGQGLQNPGLESIFSANPGLKEEMIANRESWKDLSPQDRQARMQEWLNSKPEIKAQIEQGINPVGRRGAGVDGQRQGSGMGNGQRKGIGQGQGNGQQRGRGSMGVTDLDNFQGGYQRGMGNQGGRRRQGGRGRYRN
jgi:hypothetical protein